MKRKLFCLPFLIIFFFNSIGLHQIALSQPGWTEEKIGKIALKADRAAQREKWSRAIKYGEQMLEGSRILHGQNSPETITHQKTVNRYYDKANRLNEIAIRVKNTYLMAKEVFHPTHNTSAVCRLLYYKLLISQKDYKNAIPVVLENISILTNSREDQFKHLHYLGQLHGLYGLTDMLQKREDTLLKLLDLNKKLVGDSVQNNINIIMNLAKTYCLQNKTVEFKKLSQKYDLKLKC